MSTHNTREGIEEVAIALGHDIVAAIKDFQENGKGTLWLDKVILKHLTALEQTLHQELQKARDKRYTELSPWLQHDATCYLYTGDGEPRECDCGLRAIVQDQSELDQPTPEHLPATKTNS